MEEGCVLRQAETDTTLRGRKKCVSYRQRAERVGLLEIWLPIIIKVIHLPTLSGKRAADMILCIPPRDDPIEV